ncbi:MAG: AmmeMemoRadiSam system radical SAM enzyme [bacterium]
MAKPPSQARAAALWQPVEGSAAVRCGLCHHRCLIEPGERGDCCVRENRDGALVTLTYGRLVSANVDPIEKKPLFHVLPGSTSLSVATVGCNFRCTFCQNWSISHWALQHPGRELPGDFAEPEEVAQAAVDRGCASISYTYTEPTIFWEWVADAARAAQARGVANVLVTNGYMTSEALDYVGDTITAANVDLKGLDREAQEAATGARPGPVQRTIRRMRERGIWVEVTTLVVPGLNDSEGELRGIAGFLADVDPDLPWHVSRFHPDHELRDRGPTPPETLRRACEWGREAGLRYVYAGNLRGDDNESTRCPGCGARVIERQGFRLGRVALEGGRCTACGTAVAGIGMP